MTSVADQPHRLARARRGVRHRARLADRPGRRPGRAGARRARRPRRSRAGLLPRRDAAERERVPRAPPHGSATTLRARGHTSHACRATRRDAPALDAALHDWVGRRLGRAGLAAARAVAPRARRPRTRSGSTRSEGTRDRARRAAGSARSRSRSAAPSDLARLEAIQERVRTRRCGSTPTRAGRSRPRASWCPPWSSWAWS